MTAFPSPAVIRRLVLLAAGILSLAAQAPAQVYPSDHLYACRFTLPGGVRGEEYLTLRTRNVKANYKRGPLEHFFPHNGSTLGPSTAHLADPVYLPWGERWRLEVDTIQCRLDVKQSPPPSRIPASELIIDCSKQHYPKGNGTWMRCVKLDPHLRAGIKRLDNGAGPPMGGWEAAFEPGAPTRQGPGVGSVIKWVLEKLCGRIAKVDCLWKLKIKVLDFLEKSRFCRGLYGQELEDCQQRLLLGDFERCGPQCFGPTCANCPPSNLGSACDPLLGYTCPGGLACRMQPGSPTGVCEQ